MAAWNLLRPRAKRLAVANAPEVLYKGQGGMLGVYLSPNYATDHNVYLTYSEPQTAGGSSLALGARQADADAKVRRASTA